MVEPNNVGLASTKYIPWAIILAAFIISGAIVANGERDRRFRRAHPVASSAEKATPPLISSKSVAVLPFQNMADTSQNSPYAGAIQADLIAQLATVPDLKVVDLDPRSERQAAYSSSSELGRALGVAYVIRGTVQRTGDHAKVRAKLIRTDADQTIWTATYDLQIADPFALDPELARKIAEQLRQRIGFAESLATVSASG
jgi:transcriptional activator of cad operon